MYKYILGKLNSVVLPWEGVRSLSFQFSIFGLRKPEHSVHKCGNMAGSLIGSGR